MVDDGEKKRRKGGKEEAIYLEIWGSRALTAILTLYLLFLKLNTSMTVNMSSPRYFTFCAKFAILQRIWKTGGKWAIDTTDS
jgi:hypothetical protein